MWNLLHIIFIWRRRFSQSFKSELVYLSRTTKHISLYDLKNNDSDAAYGGFADATNLVLTIWRLTFLHESLSPYKPTTFLPSVEY